MATTRILVLDRGFVLIARVKPHPKRAFWLRCRTRTIRVWGTNNGLAQLIDGPLSGTTLDPIVVEDIPYRAILRELHVNGEKWKQHLSVPQKKAKART